MDLLLKRYASPFLLLDEMISSCRFLEFVAEFMKIHNEENEDKLLWEFYLHRVFDKPYKLFSEEIKASKGSSKKVENFNSETTITDSRNILENFAPDRKMVNEDESI